MTVLVDEARWEWRGTRWAHLVSDESFDELHAFAGRIGMRRVGFQGDHYDIDQADRIRAVAHGATSVGSRELVRRLRGAGLRRRRDKPSWERIASWPRGVMVEGLDRRLASIVGRSGVDAEAGRATLLRGPASEVLLIDSPPSILAPASSAGVRVSGPRADGWWSAEIFVANPRH